MWSTSWVQLNTLWSMRPDFTRTTLEVVATCHPPSGLLFLSKEQNSDKCNLKFCYELTNLHNKRKKCNCFQPGAKYIVRSYSRKSAAHLYAIYKSNLSSAARTPFSADLARIFGEVIPVVASWLEGVPPLLAHRNPILLAALSAELVCFVLTKTTWLKLPSTLYKSWMSQVDRPIHSDHRRKNELEEAILIKDATKINPEWESGWKGEKEV